jgi:hypothetical protein
MTNIPIASVSNLLLHAKSISLFACFFLAFNLARAGVTELPPIKMPEKDQPKSAGNVRRATPVSPPVTKRIEPSSNSNSRSSGEMGDLSASDRSLVARACRSKQYYGPVAYHDCEREQAAAARNSAPVSFKGVSDSDRALISSACRSKQYHGPAAFHSCERNQVESLNTSPVPSFDGVSSGDRALIAKACRSKQYYGPAVYRTCQRDQVSQLKSTQTPIQARRQ